MRRMYPIHQKTSESKQKLLITAHYRQLIYGCALQLPIILTYTNTLGALLPVELAQQQAELMV